MTIELCKEFNCPFRGEGMQGCLHYPSASCCHLNWEEPNSSSVRSGVDATESGFPFSQHWVRVKEGTDLTPFRQAQEDFLNLPRIKQRLKEMEMLRKAGL